MAVVANRNMRGLTLRQLSAFSPLGASTWATRQTHAASLTFGPRRQLGFQAGNTKSRVLLSVKPRKAEQDLALQRLRRPLSPHLAIYKWQITSILSTLMRITGVISAGGLYLFGLTYLASPYLGLDLSSVSIAATFGALPLAPKVATKFFVAWPFAFHCFNGLRHLTWDNAKLITNVQVMRTGWAVVGVTTMSALFLALYG